MRYGAAHTITGTLVDGTSPLAGQEVVLEGRRYPYEGSYRVIERTTTDADGKFTFSPSWTATTACASARPPRASNPRSCRPTCCRRSSSPSGRSKPGVVRLYQRYTVPKTVRLSAPTLFYLGKRGAKRASLRETGELKRTGAGPLHVAGRP